MAFTKERVEFKTQDGTTLRGNLTLAGVPNAPAVIMIAGVRQLCSHYIPRLLNGQLNITFITAYFP